MTYRDDTNAALAAERADVDETLAALERDLQSAQADRDRYAEAVGAAQEVIAAQDAKIAALEARIRELEEGEEPEPTGYKTAIGTSMSKWPRGVSPTEVGRCYNDSDVTAAIGQKRRVLLWSPGQLTPAQSRSQVVALLDRMRAAGIVDPEVHFTERNEVDRHITGASAIAAYLARLRQHASGLADVPGASVWLNITRDSIRTGEADPWKLSASDGIGYAINCYSPGRKENPAEYTRFEQFIPMMFEWIATTGVTEYACWEFGTEVNGRPDTQPTTANNRHDYIYGQGMFMRAEGDKRGIKVRVLSYWNSIKTVGGEPDLTEPDNRLYHDEPLTSEALNRLAEDLAA